MIPDEDAIAAYHSLVTEQQGFVAEMRSYSMNAKYCVPFLNPVISTYSASRIPHPVFRIPHPVFRIPYSAFRITYSAFRIPHSAFRIPLCAFRFLYSVFWAPSYVNQGRLVEVFVDPSKAAVWGWGES